MKLSGTPTSPYVRKVRVVLAEKKMDYDFVVESPRAPGSTLLDINPLGRVPTLVLDDLRQLLPCFDPGKAIVLPDSASTPADRDTIVLDTAPRKLWMPCL